MMDIGMYGHGHHSQGYNPTETYYNNYSSAGADTSINHVSHQLPPTHYSNYHYEDGYLYTNTDPLENPPSPQDIYYHHHQGIAQDNPIINTEQGLSYTNLDYSNSSSNGNVYSPPINHQNYGDGYHHRTHHQESLLTDGHHSFLHDNKYLEVDPNYHHNTSSSCMEYQPLHRFKEDSSRQHLMHNPQPQPVLPTYKWMQVKRNVPKPAGDYYFLYY